jgi:flagellar basal-body rod protein FlgB
LKPHKALGLAFGLHPPGIMLEGLGANLEHYMDLLSARQKLVASNLANADTPGYKTKDIDFKREFEAQFGMEPNAVDVQGLVTKNDGNNVDVDREARMLAENALRFNIASTLVRGKISQIRSAIQDGKA